MNDAPQNDAPQNDAPGTVTAPEGVTGPIDRVMVGTDRSETAERAVQWAASFAEAFGAELHIVQVVLVTHGWHMPRALRAFKEAAAHEKAQWEIVPAPMGLGQSVERPALRWIPSAEGTQLVRVVLREKFGWWLGA